MVQRGSGDFEISEGQTVLVSGNITVPDNFSKEILKCPELASKKGNMHLSFDDFYKELQNRGYEVKELFKAVKNVEILNSGNEFI